MTAPPINATTIPVNGKKYYVSDRQKVRLWTCSVCGRLGRWGASWEWFGSLGAMEDGKWDEITVTCSDKCKESGIEAMGDATIFDPLELLDRVKKAESDLAYEIEYRDVTERERDFWKERHGFLRHSVTMAEHYPHGSDAERLETIYRREREDRKRSWEKEKVLSDDEEVDVP